MSGFISPSLVAETRTKQNATTGRRVLDMSAAGAWLWTGASLSPGGYV
jgi:hypothetical protein